MPAAPIPVNEQERLEALRSYHILDTLQERDFDEITELASAICQTPVALISLVDKDRQWFKSHKGTDVSETERDLSFCAYALHKPNDLLIVEDPKTDPRFADNPLVTGPMNINFYAGVPLVDDEGFALGSLCVIDDKKNHLNEQQLSALRILGWQVIDKLKLRKQNSELKALNDRLINAQQKVNILDAIVTDNENRWKTFIDQSPVATIIFRGPELTIEVANGAMLQMISKNADIIGKTLLEAIPELAGQGAYEMLENIYRTGETVYGYDTPVTFPHNGVEEKHYYNFTYTPIIENGVVTGIIDVAVDVTNQVLTRQRMEELNQRKDDFISIASHELKTPITALKGALQLLDKLKTKPGSEMMPKMIDQANKSMEKVVALVDDLLNATRMNEGQMTLNKTEFVIAELFGACCNHVRMEGKFDLRFEGDKELKIFADENRIDQVVVNLVNNAVKYAPNSKNMYLIAERQGDMAKLSVKDNGPGIPAEKQEHLFERYYRADHKGSQYSGLGLGLYICAEIVKRHGGEIGVDSELGKGSTFWFTLPLS